MLVFSNSNHLAHFDTKLAVEWDACEAVVCYGNCSERCMIVINISMHEKAGIDNASIKSLLHGALYVRLVMQIL